MNRRYDTWIRIMLSWVTTGALMWIIFAVGAYNEI